MIGDLVKFPHGIDKVCDLPYVEGKGICASFAASATLFPVPVEALEPIPLTPEILMKNHWIGQKGSWLHRHCDFLMCQYEDRTYDLYFDGDKDSGYITIRFVHELQHALKLCNIDLEIKV